MTLNFSSNFLYKTKITYFEIDDKRDITSSKQHAFVACYSNLQVWRDNINELDPTLTSS